MSNQWKLVPVSPTIDMLNAAWSELSFQGIEPEDVEMLPVVQAIYDAAPEKPIDTEALRGLLKHLEASRELYADVTRNAAVSHPSDAKRLAGFDRQIAALKVVLS